MSTVHCLQHHLESPTLGATITCQLELYYEINLQFAETFRFFSVNLICKNEKSDYEHLKYFKTCYSMIIYIYIRTRLSV